MQRRQSDADEGQGNGHAQRVPKVRILRMGIILGGAIVEERLIRTPQDVTIGQSAKCTFAIPTAEMPRAWLLFRPIEGRDRKTRWILHIADGMDGRISDGKNVFTLAQLREAGQMRRQGQGWIVPVPDQARGKVVIGELTVLFQLVYAPPVQPRPQLPPSVRGRFSDRIDPLMAVVLACSLVFHLGTSAYLWYKDMPAPIPPDEIPDRFAKGLMDKPVELQEKKVEALATQPGEETEEQPTDQAGDGSKSDLDSKSKGPSEKPPAPDHAAVAQAVQNTAVLKVLGARSSDGSGRFADVTGGRDAGGDLGRGLQNVGASGVGIALGVGGGLGGGTRGPATGEIGTGRYTGVGGPAGTGGVGTERSEDAIKTDVRTGPLDTIDAGGLDPDKVMSTIKSRYFSGVRQCYERALKGNPTLQGKVVVSISIGPAGNVTKASVSGFDNGVDQCIQQKARGWRFMKPESGSAEFEIPFILRPGG